LPSDRRVPHAAPAEWRNHWSTISRAGLIGADATAFLISFSIVVLLRDFVFGGEAPPLHWANYLAVTAWFLLRWMSGRYSFGQYAPEELQKSFLASFVAGLIHLAVLIANAELEAYRLFNLLIWPLVLPFTYSLREIWRNRCIKAGRYGVPIAVVGNGQAARRAVRELRAQTALGYVPIALFSTERARAHEFRQMLGVPMIGRSEEAATYRFPFKARHALLAVGSGWEDERDNRLAAQLGRRFTHLQIFTDLAGTGHWLSEARALGPYITIHTRNVRLTTHQRLLKRSMDVAISLPVLLLSSPLILLAGIAIKLADPGPVFFSQLREGRGGKPIRIWKLRSMVQGAEAKLAKHLAENEAARFEYERTMKLRQDPRILPVIGQLIRKASIDELPQLWSILKGDMSLVGPRVMPTREVDLYSPEGRETRRDMPPGLTGFWQVEHRSNSDFQVRETADSFYVANWSVWLDLWIILRTVRVVLTGSGAY
jgi:Undecaprenyl-phosphate galactose phosphotransferase WbaP